MSSKDTAKSSEGKLVQAGELSLRRACYAVYDHVRVGTRNSNHPNIRMFTLALPCRRCLRPALLAAQRSHPMRSLADLLTHSAVCYILSSAIATVPCGPLFAHCCSFVRSWSLSENHPCSVTLFVRLFAVPSCITTHAVRSESRQQHVVIRSSSGCSKSLVRILCCCRRCGIVVSCVRRDSTARYGLRSA